MDKQKNVFISKLASILGLSRKSVSSQKKRGRSIQIEMLEDRVLLDAAGLNSAPVLDLSALDYDESTGYYSIDITAGSPWQAALSATDVDGDNIYFNVTPEDSDLLTTTVSAGKTASSTVESNPYWKLTVTWTNSAGVKQTGTMVFELFQNEAPDAVNRIIEATNSGFYNNTLFDYISKGSLTYGGSFDASDSYIAEKFETIDDNFSSSLRHTSKGLVGIIPANLTLYGNDTNTTQFYITSSSQTKLDYNLSIFGNLISGYDVLDAVNSVSTGTHTVSIDGKDYQYSDWPTNPVTITSAEIINSNAYNVAQSGTTSVGSTVTLKSSLKVTTEQPYTTSMTVTAVDSNGNVSDAIKVKVNIAAADTTDVPPYITDLNLTEMSIPSGQYGNGLIKASDANGDQIYYWVGLYAQNSTTLLTNYYGYNETSGYFEVYSHQSNSSTGTALAPGVYNLYVVVASGTEESDWNSGDSQMIPVYILPAAPKSVALTDSSYNEDESDGTTSKTSGLTFHTTGNTVGNIVEVYTTINGKSTLIGSAKCTNSDGAVDVPLNSDISLVSGSYELFVRQVLVSDVAVGNTRITGKRLESTVLSGYTITINDTDNKNAPLILDPLFSTPSWESGKEVSLVGENTAYAFEDEQFTLLLRATDADDDVVQWSIVSATGDIYDSLTLTATDTLGGAAITWTPGEVNGGNEYTIVVQASDGRGLVTQKSIKIYVNEVEDVPVFQTVNDQAGVAGQWIWFSVKAGDPDPTNAQILINVTSAPTGFSTSDLLYRSTNVYNDDGSKYLYTQYEVIVKIPATALAGDLLAFEFQASKTVSGSTLSTSQAVTIHVLDDSTYQSLLDKSAPSLEYVAGSGMDSTDTWVTNKNNSALTSIVSFLGHDLTPQSPVLLLADDKIIGIEKDVVVSDRVVSSTYGWTLSDGEHKITIAQPVQTQLTTDSGTINVDIVGPVSNALTIEVDTTAPVLDDSLSSNLVTEGVAFTASVSASDSHAVKYSLVDAPDGMTINSSTGVISWTPNFADGVINTITVTATDILGNSSTKSYDLEIVLAPELVIPDCEINELTSWTYNLDAENVTQYTLVSGPDGLTLNAPATEGGKWYLSWTPTEQQGGVAQPYQVQVSVSNAAGATRLVTFNITALEINSDPVLTPIEDQSVLEGQQLNLTVSVSDSDLPAQNITWSLDNAPEGMTISAGSDSYSAIISWKPSELQGGKSYTVTVIADDGFDSAIQTVIFTAVEVDDVPIFDEVTLPIVFSGKPGVIVPDSEISIQFKAADPDTPANDIIYSLTGESTNGASINSSTGEFFWNPSDSSLSAGTYNFTVRATEDSANGVYTEYSFSLTIADSIAISSTPDTSASEATVWTYNPTTNVDAVDWRTVSWTISNAPEGLSFNSQTGAMTWTPSETHGGNTYTFIITAADQGGEISQTVTVNVAEIDDAPIFKTPILPAAFDGKSGSFIRGNSVEIAFSAADPDIPTNGIIYSLVGESVYGAAIDPSTGAFTWNPSADLTAGEYTFTIKATEDSELGNSSQYEITLTLVDSLVLNPIESAEINEGYNWSYTPTTNADNCDWRPLSWSIADAPEGVSINAQTGLIQWTPSEIQGGQEYTFTVSVSDGLSSQSETITVSAVEVDDVPVFDTSSIPDSNRVISGSTITVNFKAADPDIPANSIGYSIVSAPEGATIDSASGRFVWSVGSTMQPGNYTIIVRATEIITVDGNQTSGLYTDYSLTISVVNVLIPSRPEPSSPFDRLNLSDRAAAISRDVLIDIAANSSNYRGGSLLDSYFHQESLRAYENISGLFGIQFGSQSRSLGEIKPADNTDSKDEKSDQKKNPDSKQQKTEGDAERQKGSKNQNSSKFDLHVKKER